MTPHDLAVEAVTRMAHDPLVDEAEWAELREHVRWQIETGDTQRRCEYQAVLWALGQEREACAALADAAATAALDHAETWRAAQNAACRQVARAIRERGMG